MEAGSIDEVTGRLNAVLDDLLGLDLTMIDSVGLTVALREFENARRRLAAVDQHLLSEIDQRGMAGEYARCTTAELVITLLRVAPAEAKARLAQARDLTPTRMPSGELAPAVLPRCAAAVASGEISTAHVTVISKAIDQIPSDIAYEAAPVAEAMLIDAARHQHPPALAQTAALLLARLDPDGSLPREADLERRRSFTLHRRGTDEFARPDGRWTPELTAVWDAILDSLSAPQPATDGMPDDRSPAQRRHDALLEAGQRLLRSGTLPSSNGTPITVLVRTTLADLADPGGVAQTERGTIWPTRRVTMNLGDVAVVSIVIDHNGAALMCGRTKRLATRAQRLALTTRDGGCSFPGCGRPAAWCEVHHILEWIMNGSTDIDNLCLLCAYHHREFARRGWTVHMSDGLPYWTPPAFIDADRTPIRNTTHHLPDFDFRDDDDIGRAG